MTPSRSGLIAMMFAGVRPTIRFASAPIARTRFVRASIATTDGSLMTMPRSRTCTSVFAVPRSIPMSRENRPRIRSSIRKRGPSVAGSSSGRRRVAAPWIAGCHAMRCAGTRVYPRFPIVRSPASSDDPRTSGDQVASPLRLEDRVDDLIDPLALDELALDEVGLPPHPEPLHDADRGDVPGVSTRPDAVQPELVEPDAKQLTGSLRRQAATL